MLPTWYTGRVLLFASFFFSVLCPSPDFIPRYTPTAGESSSSLRFLPGISRVCSFFLSFFFGLCAMLLPLPQSDLMESPAEQALLRHVQSVLDKNGQTMEKGP